MKGCSSAVLLNPPPPPSTLIRIRSSTVSEWRDALVQCFSTPPLYTDSYQIFHCVWMKGCSSAVLLHPPPPPPPPPSTLIRIRSSTVSEWRDALVQCFSTPPPPLYTDSYQIFHCVWMKGCSSAVLLNPPLYTDSYQIFHCVWMKGCSSAVLLTPPLYTDSYQIFHCVWMKGCSSAVLLHPPSTLIRIRSSTVSEWRDALVQCFSTPPPSTVISIRSSTVSEWRDALVQCFSTPPPLHWFVSDLPLCLNKGML